jgi:hypothetical protein
MNEDEITKSTIKDAGPVTQKAAFYIWLFLQITGLMKDPMFFLQTFFLFIIAITGIGIVFGVETIVIFLLATVLVIIILAYALHRTGFFKALRNYEYGGKDNDTWDRRNNLSGARAAYYIKFSSKEELEEIIETEKDWLFKKWSGKSNGDD